MVETDVGERVQLVGVMVGVMLSLQSFNYRVFRVKVGSGKYSSGI